MVTNINKVMGWVRKNIQDLQPYSSARSEFTEPAKVHLDANENPFDWEYNRYPDPLQGHLKKVISTWRNIPTPYIFLGNGSDEVIDVLIRTFCEPAQDSIVVMNPSYGMYKVTADVNNVHTRFFNLDADFGLDLAALFKFMENRDKLLFLCSPNNPTGNALLPDQIQSICHHFNGLVVLDEAYIDFSDIESCLSLVLSFPNLVIIQTLSKAVGCAGIRLGMGFMHPDITAILNKIKHPYNISTPNQQIAIRKLLDVSAISEEIQIIKTEREKLIHRFLQLDIVLKVFPSEANFLLVRFHDADLIYQYLLSFGIVVRNRSRQYGCDGCLRITIGKPDENEFLFTKLSEYSLKSI